MKIVIVRVERKNPIEGTMAFRNGFSRFAAKKNITMTMYVRIRITNLRVHEVSHALSSSTFLLRVLIVSISFCKEVSVGMWDYNMPEFVALQICDFFV